MEEKPTKCVAEKAGIDDNNCLKEKGNTADEIVLKFDDGKELYVSEGFLSYVSPVFKAMFTHECKEKVTREVELTGKDFANFHNFLLCLHPGVQLEVDRINVLRISALANEYQVMPTVAKCKQVMMDWILSESDSCLEVRYPLVRSCLEILHKALECDFEEVIQAAEAHLSKFAYEIFTGLTQLPPVTRYLKVGQPCMQITQPVSGQVITAKINFIPGPVNAIASRACHSRSRTCRSRSRPFRSPSPAFRSLSPAFRSPSSAFRSPSPAFRSPSPAYRSPSPAYRSPSPTSCAKQAVVFKDENVNEPAECKRLFDELPEKVKINMLLMRLRLCDDGQFRGVPVRN